MSWRSLGRYWRSVGPKSRFMPLLTELARASGVMVAIQIALVTELGLSPPPKMRLGCRAHRLRKLGLDVKQFLQTRAPRHGGKVAGK